MVTMTLLIKLKVFYDFFVICQLMYSCSDSHFFWSIFAVAYLWGARCDAPPWPNHEKFFTGDFTCISKDAFFAIIGVLKVSRCCTRVTQAERRVLHHCCTDAFNTLWYPGHQYPIDYSRRASHTNTASSPSSWRTPLPRTPTTTWKTTSVISSCNRPSCPRRLMTN